MDKFWCTYLDKDYSIFYLLQYYFDNYDDSLISTVMICL